MRLQAYTLIEGIVSMVILSILLSVVVLVSFNLYNSLPKDREVHMRSILELELDSLTKVSAVEELVYYKQVYLLNYQTAKSERFENMRLATMVIRDSLGTEITKEKLYLSYE